MTSLLNSIKNLAKQTGEDTKTRFSVTPSPGDSGFTQWQNGMRAVARLPEGIPPQFRKTLWLNLAEKHLASRGVQWQQVEESCFNEFTNPDDEELGVQIVKDVHRTGCSLFCGVSGKDNQALLKRVLLAYARWNKAVGYCQGFNMLAALILQVMDKSEVDSVKVMIYLIEGVLPESYFANSLRGLSVDMAVFRDLLRIKLPVLSKHFDQLQCGDSKDCGSSYEPPLTNVFTMQWFLTLFCNCLPQETVLRVWDLIFLEGNHVLLCTALAIWSTLADRILTVESADEFYCIMGVLTREMLEFGLMDANGLIKAIVSFSLPELAELREKYLYNITPWTQSVSTVAKRGLRLFYSDEDTDTEEDDEKIAIATAYGLFRSPKKKDGASGVTSPPRALTCPDKEKIAMDISALTKQYRKLRERQKQAHVILTAACGSQSLVGPTTSPAMNHLLMGKFALVNSRGRRLGPPPGSIPPPAQSRSHPGERQKIVISGETLHWKDTAGVKKTPPTDDEEEKSPDSSPSKHSSRRSSSSSSSTELCDDPQRLSDSEDLSDSLAPSLGSQPSTPLRSPRPKMRHPVDVESCKEEIEEITDSLLEANLKSDESSQPELEHKLKEDLFSINIDEEEDHSQQKRKPSFRIDPEELRQLDRKLSLKIVEIERRKSSAGIESEDLDSKVLFPFDRDYIQEGLKTNRGDTPTSIPDDRLCSMDDFSCDFEEETIPVPDLITTHKPFNHRMSSLEECDESKLNENVDATEVIKAESFDENESEFKSFSDSEENYECQESSHIDTNFNFDELFLDNTTSTECCPDQIIVPSGDDVDLDSITVVEKTCSVQNSISTSSISDISTIKYISQQSENNHDTGIGLELTTGKLMNNVGKTPLSSTSLLTTKSMSQDICSETNSFGFEQDSSKNSSPKCSIPEVKQEDFYDSKTNNTAANSFLITQQVSEIEDKKEFGFEVDMDKNKANIVSDTTPTSIVHTSTSRLKYSQENLEKKLANLLPSIPVYRSLDTKIPDVAAVSSRDEEINLIRRKYANFSQGSIESNTSEPVNNEVFQGIVSNPVLLESFTKTENHENKLDLSLIKVTECSTKSSEDKKSNENKILSLLQNQNTSDSPVLRTVSDREKVLVDSKFRNEIKCIDNTQTCIRPEKPDHLESDNISKESTGKEPQKSTCPQTLIDFEKPKHPESPIESCSLEKYKNKSSSPSPNRRGSEVALSLILKENSKILSKIQHQSRRNSEFSGDATFKEEQKKHENYKNQENNDTLELKLGEEIASLKKIDSNSLCSSTETLLFSQILNKSSNNVDLTNTINQNETRMSSNLFEANVSSPFQQSSEDKVETVTEIDDKHEILLRPRKCKDSLQISTNYLDAHETDEHITLPDVCKLDGYSNKISKYGADCEVSNVRNVGSTSSELNVLQEDSVAESSPKGFVNKGFIETYRYTLGSGLEPYTIDSTNHNSVLSFQTPSVGERILDTRAIPSEDYEREQIQRSYVFKDYMDSDGITSTKHFTDTFSETNEDILKELQALDIKPEDTVSSFGTNNNPLSPTYSNNSCPYNKKGGKHIAEEASNNYSPSDHSFRFVSSKNDSDDNFCEMRTSRKFIQNHFRDNKASSLDTCTSMKDVSTMFLDDKCKSLFVRSATVVEDDDSLYINSYKSHGRLLIEKGELDTFQNSNVNSTSFSEKVSLDEKPKDFVVRSAYELNETSSVSPHSSFSQFLPRDSKFPELSEIEKKDRSNFRSENHKGSVSPSRCRFTSASPVQKRLDPLYIEPSSSNSASSRISASPQQTLKCRESSCYTSFDDYTMSDYSYRDTSDFKKYHYRTESLDFEPKKPDRPSLHQRKRADSYEISTSEKASQDKKTSPPTSPVKFNPFPIRSSARQPKELGIKLGLYLPQKSDKSPSKRLT